MLLPIPRFVQYYEYKFKQSKTQSSFSAFLPCSHLARVVFRNEVSSPDAICFAPKGRGSFPGFKKKSFKLSRLPSFFAKEGSISLTLTVSFIVACGEGLCTCSFMVEQNRLLVSRQRRSPSSIVVLDCSQCPFFP